MVIRYWKNHIACVIINHLWSSKLHQRKSFHKEAAAHLKRCSRFEDVEAIQASMIKTNATQDCYLMNQFITACASLNQIDYGVSAFAQMDSPNIFAYNALISGFVHCSCPFRALVSYLEILRAQLCPTSYTFSPLIKACGAVSAMGFGEGVHCHVLRNGFQTNVFVQTALLDYYGTLGRSVESKKVFDEMPERDSFAWAMMVLVHARSGNMCDARDLFAEMPVRNTASWNGMINGYARAGDMECAKTLFDQMPQKDLVSWTTMITSYSRNKQYKEALAIFDKMMRDGICPDEVTIAAVIASCAHLGALDLGRKIHYYVMQQGLCLDVYIGSSLVDMYAKCGSIGRALVMFLKLREKNLFCWNAIIGGLAVHGYPKEALRMFERMLDGNIRPNSVTFVSTLSACTHGGLLEEGRQMFRSMINTFSIYPEFEHYGCMVDLLCKAGLVDDALDLIRSMESEPNSVIWGGFLSGCKQCKNLEMAELAVRKLTALEPDNCGYYTLSVNMYAQANKWNDVARIRTTMKELGIEKSCPGSSWIEMDEQVHQFTAADVSHPAFVEIYVLLDNLDGRLKAEGLDSKYGVFL
ncbi:hypothetical protein Dimus_026525 [Dionaea muscipula]